MAELLAFLALPPAKQSRAEDILYALRGELEPPPVLQDEEDYDDMEDTARSVLDYQHKLLREYRKKQIALAICLKRQNVLPLEMQLHVLSFTAMPVRPEDWIDSQHSPLHVGLTTLEDLYGGPRDIHVDMIANSILFVFPMFGMNIADVKKLIRIFVPLLRPNDNVPDFFRVLFSHLYKYEDCATVLELTAWFLQQYGRECLDGIDDCILNVCDWDDTHNATKRKLIRLFTEYGTTELCQLLQ